MAATDPFNRCQTILTVYVSCFLIKITMLHTKLFAFASKFRKNIKIKVNRSIIERPTVDPRDTGATSGSTVARATVDPLLSGSSVAWSGSSLAYNE